MIVSSERMAAAGPDRVANVAILWMLVVAGAAILWRVIPEIARAWTKEFAPS